MDKIAGSLASPNRSSTKDASDVCRIFKELLDVLDNTRRMKILNALATEAKTFEELKAEIEEISTGSLHHHLGVLHRAGIVGINQSRPMTYYRTGLLDCVAEVFSDQVHSMQPAYLVESGKIIS
jgi:DNA-binding transcriptional ArsR family regulator